MRQKGILLLTLLLFFQLAFNAQEKKSGQLSETEWRQIADDTDYSEYYKSRDAEENSNATHLPSSGRFQGLKYIIYFIVLALIAFFSYRLLSGDHDVKISTEKTDAVSLEEIEEKVNELDLDALLEEAVRLKNYRLALRLHFLIVVKLLSQRGTINWASEKTNWEYHSEVRDKLLADQFREVIIRFESFWYGERPIDESDFVLSEPLFRSLQKKLRPG